MIPHTPPSHHPVRALTPLRSHSIKQQPPLPPQTTPQRYSRGSLGASPSPVHSDMYSVNPTRGQRRLDPSASTPNRYMHTDSSAHSFSGPPVRQVRGRGEQGVTPGGGEAGEIGAGSCPSSPNGCLGCLATMGRVTTAKLSAKVKRFSWVTDVRGVRDGDIEQGARGTKVGCVSSEPCGVSVVWWLVGACLIVTVTLLLVGLLVSFD
eukprot:GHVN01069904.1.p1 GENE.GHVN01069904.1~~GHVN01069904.1.p1  ORF type:complete len:232 (+),score=52.50 GHVN01069904.1:77-697(+)